jgi:hypothetical protein
MDWAHFDELNMFFEFFTHFLELLTYLLKGSWYVRLCLDVIQYGYVCLLFPREHMHQVAFGRLKLNARIFPQPKTYAVSSARDSPGDC